MPPFASLNASLSATTLRGTLLIVDDVAANIGALSHALESEGHRVLAAISGKIALNAAVKARPDLILLDILMPDMDGIETCRRLKAQTETRDIPVIFVTANEETSYLVEGFRAGGVDFITKPFRMEEVFARVGTHLRLSRLTRDLAARTEELQARNAELTAEIKKRRRAEAIAKDCGARLSIISEAEARKWSMAGLVGRSTAFSKVLKEVEKLQSYPRTNVLITGESGTGKELVARAIHFGGSQANGPFIPVNCSALPPDKAESQLFGHCKGAFAGAETDCPGLFQMANGGTLFLDEVGDMPLPLQSKLLRVLEDGKFLPLGSIKELAVQVRVLASTNGNLTEKVAEGTFREDLYYRLASFHVPIPPLRERVEDIPALSQHFLRHFAEDLKRPLPELKPATLKKLLSHPYRGNVRELKNTIERAIIYAGEKDVCPEHIVFSPHVGSGAEAENGNNGSLNVTTAEDTAWADIPFNLMDAEAKLIQRAITACNGNISHAARLLGINRAKIYRHKGK